MPASLSEQFLFFFFSFMLEGKAWEKRVNCPNVGMLQKSSVGNQAVPRS